MTATLQSQPHGGFVVVCESCGFEKYARSERYAREAMATHNHTKHKEN